MGHPQIKTVTSREFVHNASAAKRVASEGGTVIITDRGQPFLALIPIAEYRRLTKTDQNLVDLLRMPEGDSDEFDFEPVSLHARTSTHDKQGEHRTPGHLRPRCMSAVAMPLPDAGRGDTNGIGRPSA